nr:ATP-grasp domain-containing protein [Tessaracoccus massiliensis]
MRTLVASLPSQSAPGLELADEVLHADISNPEAVRVAAEAYAISGVATSCADTGLDALAALCEARNLPGLTTETAAICGDKTLMKQSLVRGGVNTARFSVVASVEQLMSAVSELQMPVIVKATDLQGSKGIAVVRERASLEAAFLYASSQSSRKSVIVEEFIEGLEFGAQALVVDGQIVFVLLHDDGVFQAATAIPIEHSVPCSLSAELQASAHEQIVAAIRAVCLDNCAVNVDLIVRGDEVFVIELSGRVGANGLPEMVSAYFGIDYYEVLAQVAMGLSPQVDWGAVAAPHVVVRMLAEPELHGTIGRVVVDKSKEPSAEIVLFKTAGDVLEGFSHSGHCVGQIMTTGASEEQARLRMDNALEAYRIELKAAQHE